MPIGLRTVKSAAAVFICFSISHFFLKDGYPFYSAIAALLCMQRDISDSFKTGANRIIGTLIGGTYGIIVFQFCRSFSLVGNTMPYYMLISLLIIPLIYISVLLNKKSAVYISCVVFLSIVVSHSEDASVLYFGLSRIIETLLGIVTALIVNMYMPYSKPSPDILFISSLDGTLLNDKKQLNAKTIKIINKQISRGMNFTIATAGTPAAAVDVLSSLNLNLPIICMNGSVVYDINTNTYLKYGMFDNDTTRILIEIIERGGSVPFIYVIDNNKMLVYIAKLANKAQEEFYNKGKMLELKKDIFEKYDFKKPPVFIMLLDKHEIIKKIHDEIKLRAFYPELYTASYSDSCNEGYSYLEISDKTFSEKMGAEFVKEIAMAKNTAYFGRDTNDIPLIGYSDISFAVENAADKIKMQADKVIGSNNNDAVAMVLKSFKQEKFK